jgi:hypothetical protein
VVAAGLMAGIASAIAGFERAVKDAANNATKQAAEEVRLRMVKRLARGVGTNERQFTPYAISTAKRKGRRRPVNLYQTGHMVSSLRVVKSGNKYQVRIVGLFADRKARWQQFGTKKDGRQRIPPRQWFGITTRDARTTGNKYASSFNTKLSRDRRTRFKVIVGSK